MMNICFDCSPISLNSTRAVTSVPPPAGKGTITRTGLAG